jgi:hypothetical protein
MALVNGSQFLTMPGWGQSNSNSGSSIMNPSSDIALPIDTGGGGGSAGGGWGWQKDALNQAKEQFAKNYAAQRGITNSALSDRQIARNAAGPGYQDTAGYMSQYGIA